MLQRDGGWAGAARCPAAGDPNGTGRGACRVPNGWRWAVPVLPPVPVCPRCRSLPGSAPGRLRPPRPLPRSAAAPRSRRVAAPPQAPPPAAGRPITALGARGSFFVNESPGPGVRMRGALTLSLPPSSYAGWRRAALPSPPPRTRTLGAGAPLPSAAGLQQPRGGERHARSATHKARLQLCSLSPCHKGAIKQEPRF